MSISGNYTGGVERPKPVRLTTTTLTDIVEAFDKSTVLAAFALVNETSPTVEVDCYFFDGTTDFLIFRVDVPGTSATVVNDLPIRLYSGDKFKVVALAANAITVTPIIIRTHPNESAYASGTGIPGRN